MRKLTTDAAKDQFKRVIGKNMSLGEFDTTKETYIDALKVVWDNYYGKDVSAKVRQGFYNMVLSHYAETKLDDLPSGSVGFVLGRKKAFNKHIKKVLEARGMTWEREDSSKATFFIIGDIMTRSENQLNSNLSKPIVMDITIENEYHHKHSGTDYVTSVNERVLTALFQRGERKDLDTMSMLLKFIHAESLTNLTRTRLVLQYLKCVGQGYDYSDKAHKNLIRLMRRLTLPQHQFLLEPKFSNSYNSVRYNLRGNSTLASNGVPNLGHLAIGNSWSNSSVAHFIPMEEDTLDLFLLDREADLDFDMGLKDFNKFKWASEVRTSNVFDGHTMKATTSLTLGELQFQIEISYFSPEKEEEPCFLLEARGRIPHKEYYGGIGSTPFNYGDTTSTEILNTMRKTIRDPKYKYKNVDEWTSNLYSPIKQYMEDYIKKASIEFYGKDFSFIE